MLNFVTISNKRIINQDNEDIVDLSESVFDNTKAIKISRTVIVTSEFEGRPAYLSKVLLKDESHADILLSINGISNPLSLKSGTRILVPDITSLNVFLKNNNDDSLLTGNKAMISLNVKNNPKFNNADPNRNSSSPSNSSSANQQQLLRTPNMTPPGSQAVSTDNGGSIVLGTNTSTSRCKSDLTNAQTRTEIIRNAVRTNILSKLISNVNLTKTPIALSISNRGVVSQTPIKLK